MTQTTTEGETQADILARLALEKLGSQARRRTGLDHGYTKYTEEGCRCGICRQAFEDSQAEDEPEPGEPEDDEGLDQTETPDPDEDEPEDDEDADEDTPQGGPTGGPDDESADEEDIDEPEESDESGDPDDTPVAAATPDDEDQAKPEDVIVKPESRRPQLVIRSDKVPPDRLHAILQVIAALGGVYCWSSDEPSVVSQLRGVLPDLPERNLSGYLRSLDERGWAVILRANPRRISSVTVTTTGARRLGAMGLTPTTEYGVETARADPH